jgi:hypothetical protein
MQNIFKKKKKKTRFINEHKRKIIYNKRKRFIRNIYLKINS